MRAHPQAGCGILAIAAAHATMLAVMVIAPLQMDHNHTGLGLIGAIVGVHITGMYALSPVIGWCTDTFGPRPVLLTGAAVLLAAVVLTGTAGTSMSRFTIGLILVGLGWSCTLIPASAAVTSAVPLTQRPAVQGLSDLVMGLAGGAAGALAGIAVAIWGFAPPTVAEAAAAGVVAVAALAIRGREPFRSDDWTVA